MCGRFLLIASPEELRALFGFLDDEPGPLPAEPGLAGRVAGWFPPRYNIAPTQPIAIVRETPRGRRLALVRWGLVPPYVKDPRTFRLLINARSETAAETGAFRAAMRYRRCLVPASGFYEWRREASGRKQAFHIRPRGGGLLAFAGLWETWLGADGSEIDSGAILTTAANPTVAPIHDRMPVIVAPGDFALWLSAKVPAEEVAGLLQPADESVLEAIPIGPRVNSADNDDAALLDPVDPAVAAAADAERKARPRRPDPQLKLF